VQILEFEQGGKKKKVERKLTLHCHACRVDLACPPDQDFWFWMKSAEAIAFVGEHKSHGNERTLVPEITHIERE